MDHAYTLADTDSCTLLALPKLRREAVPSVANGVELEDNI